jgi:hypothetical protein
MSFDMATALAGPLSPSLVADHSLLLQVINALKAQIAALEARVSQLENP